MVRGQKVCISIYHVNNELQGPVTKEPHAGLQECLTHRLWLTCFTFKSSSSRDFVVISAPYEHTGKRSNVPPGPTQEHKRKTIQYTQCRQCSTINTYERLTINTKQNTGSTQYWEYVELCKAGWTYYNMLTDSIYEHSSRWGNSNGIQYLADTVILAANICTKNARSQVYKLCQVRYFSEMR